MVIGQVRVGAGGERRIGDKFHARVVHPGRLQEPAADLRGRIRVGGGFPEAAMHRDPARRFRVGQQDQQEPVQLGRGGVVQTEGPGTGQLSHPDLVAAARPGPVGVQDPAAGQARPQPAGLLSQRGGGQGGGAVPGRAVPGRHRAQRDQDPQSGRADRAQHVAERVGLPRYLRAQVIAGQGGALAQWSGAGRVHDRGDRADPLLHARDGRLGLVGIGEVSRDVAHVRACLAQVGQPDVDGGGFAGPGRPGQDQPGAAVSQHPGRGQQVPGDPAADQDDVGGSEAGFRAPRRVPGPRAQRRGSDPGWPP